MCSFFMQPSSIVGQVNRSMNAGVPALDQMSSSNPGFNPGMMPPASSPMPNMSPAIGETALHRHFKRAGQPVPQQLQGQPAPQVPPEVAQQATASSAPQPAMPVSETELILKALSHHLDHKGKMEEKLLNAMIPEPNGIQG